MNYFQCDEWERMHLMRRNGLLNLSSMKYSIPKLMRQTDDQKQIDKMYQLFLQILNTGRLQWRKAILKRNEEHIAMVNS